MEPRVCFVMLYCIMIPGNADAKIKKGWMNSDEHLAFLDNFLFWNNGGNRLNYEIRYPIDQCCYHLALFDDSPFQWTSVRPYRDMLTCSQKLDRITDSRFNIELSEENGHCHTVYETENDEMKNWLLCSGQIDFSDQPKPRWWFFNLVNCRKRAAGVWNVSYSLHMTNGETALSRELSADDKYIMETDLTLLAVYIIMCVAATKYRYELNKKKMLHLTYRLFYNSLALQTFSFLLHTSAFIHYARTGTSLTSTLNAAEIFSCLSSILFVTMLLLVSKGFSITRATISPGGTIKVFIAAVIYAISFLVLFIYQNVLFDPRDVIFKQSTAAAAGIIGLKFAGFIWMVYGVFFTVKEHPTKAVFYIPFAIFFGVWFLTEPVIILAASGAAELYRNNTSYMIKRALSFLGHACFLYLTRPESLNRRFPFHLPTNKVSVAIRDARDVDDEDQTHYPAENFYSVFITGGASESDTRVSTADIQRRLEPEHFETPVMDFVQPADDEDDEVHYVRSIPLSPSTARTRLAGATTPTDRYSPDYKLSRSRCLTETADENQRTSVVSDTNHRMNVQSNVETVPQPMQINVPMAGLGSSVWTNRMYSRARLKITAVTS